MNYAFLPDLSALAILIAILLLLRRRHPHPQADIWLLGLLITLVESSAHIFYARDGLPSTVLHVVVVDCYLLAGLVFTWSSGKQVLPFKTRLLYVALNGLPLLVVNTLYGLHIYTPRPYYPVVAAGIIIGAISSLYIRRSRLFAVLQVCGWFLMGLLIHSSEYRQAVYWSLCVIYAIAALNFQHRLPTRSTGRLAILTGFYIWALCFLIHPSIVRFRDYADIASHVWNMQKSLISIGMLLVMLEEQISNNHWLALHDELTGLPNRRLFQDRLTSALDRSRRTQSSLALVMLDLNGFKKINDTLGHHAGDQVLREISRNLRDSVQTSHTLARVGGDEFTMIASDLSRSGDRDLALDKLLNTVRDAVEKPLLIDGQSMTVTASLGIAIYPDDADDATRLLRVADQRMYSLKRKQKPASDLSPSRRLRLDRTDPMLPGPSL
jgi:diguanylate cyclase (GGDEF)-like protein